MDLIQTCIDPELDNPESTNQYIPDIESVTEDQLNGRYFAGLDLGKQIDHSVLAIVQVTEQDQVRLIHKRQFPLGTPYPEVTAYAARVHQIFTLEGMHVDKTGIGDAVTDELERLEIPEVKGIFFTDAEKENLLTNLKLLMEKKQLSISGEDKQLIAQINEQQHEYLKPKTAQERIHQKFRHPKGRHDDQLYALALACYAAKEAGEEPFLAVIPR